MSAREPMGERVARIETKLESIGSQIDRNHAEVKGMLEPLKAQVGRHSRQITFWRGGFWVVSFLWGSLLAYLGIKARSR